MVFSRFFLSTEIERALAALTLSWWILYVYARVEVLAYVAIAQLRT